MVLNDIVKKNNQWVSYAYSISRDKHLANDIVQEMYLRVFYIKKEINERYVMKIIKNIFFDLKKKKKNRVIFVESKYLESIADEEGFSIDDRQKKIIDNFEKLDDYHKDLIIESYDKSLRKMQKEFGVNYGHIYRELKKARKKILSNESGKERISQEKP